MKRARLLRWLALAVILSSLVIARSSFAQPPAAQPAGGAAMQDAMKLMMPGEAHKGFAKMSGKWTSKMKVWNSATPGQPPMESSGETETKLVLGGRYLLEEAKGSVMGMPMQR